MKHCTLIYIIRTHLVTIPSFSMLHAEKGKIEKLGVAWERGYTPGAEENKISYGLDIKLWQRCKHRRDFLW